MIISTMQQHLCGLFIRQSSKIQHRLTTARTAAARRRRRLRRLILQLGRQMQLLDDELAATQLEGQIVRGGRARGQRV